jgi:hypothetical protein
MGHSKSDRQLDEVKAVLQRLQHISDDLDPVGPAVAHEEAARRPSPAANRSVAVAAGVAAAVVLVVLGGYALFGSKQHTLEPPMPSAARLSAEPTSQHAATPGLATAARPNAAPSPPPQAPPAPQASLQDALALMAGGQVQAARRELVGIGPERSADVAWALARSYDPNFLSTIAAPDAAPDVAQATRWYRTWHALAVKEGLVADSVSLERIIRSMR